MQSQSPESRQRGIMLRALSIVFLKFFAMGVFFGLILLGISLFETGQKAEYLRLGSTFLPLIGALAGLAKIGSMIIENHIRRSKKSGF